MGTTTSLLVTSIHTGIASRTCWAWRIGDKNENIDESDTDQCREDPYQN